MLPKAVFLDWDNTLVDTFPALFQAHNHVRKEWGVKLLSEAEARLEIRLAAKDYFPKLYGDDWQKAADEFYRFFGEIHISSLEIFEGSRDLITFLKAHNIACGIVSNKRTDILIKELEHLDWQVSDFSCVVGAGDVTTGKPDPQGLYIALERSSLTRENASGYWYVGDTENDMLTANNAGFSGVYVKNLPMSDIKDVKRHQPLYMFETTKDLLEHLRSIR